MIFQRVISRVSGESQALQASNFHPFVKFSKQSSKPFSQITQKCDLLSESSVNSGPRFLGNLGSLKFARFIHSGGPKEFKKGMDNEPVETQKTSGFFEGSNRIFGDVNTSTLRTGRLFEGLSQRLTNIETGNREPRPLGRDTESGFNNRSMNFVRGIMNYNRNDNRTGVENNADIVHIKIMRNNTFVTVTDSKGNKKIGASAGSLAEMKGGPKVSKYAAEATAEHVGRVAKSMGLKSVVMKVNGFTHFKRKKLAILSFRDGYTNSRSDQNPVVYIEDTTRKPHNGCRLRKQRRV